jgi:hypothetical protein
VRGSGLPESDTELLPDEEELLSGGSLMEPDMEASDMLINERSRGPVTG